MPAASAPLDSGFPRRWLGIALHDHALILSLELRSSPRPSATFAAVDSIDLDIGEGEFFTIVGPSGSGKTTLLRMLAGMESADQRRYPAARQAHQRRARQPAADLHGVPVAGPVPAPHGRPEHRVPAEDPRRRRRPSARRARWNSWSSCACRKTTTARTSRKCSGGERQRVALARALAYDPDILFFDEPLSAIDYKLRKTLEKELKDIHRETGKTFVYITHSLEEAMVMSDRIGVMRAGRLVQVGTPQRDLHRAQHQVRLRVHRRRERHPGDG